MTIKFPKDSYLNIYLYLKFPGEAVSSIKSYMFFKQKKTKGKKMRQDLAVCNQIGSQNFETL